MAWSFRAPRQLLCRGLSNLALSGLAQRCNVPVCVGIESDDGRGRKAFLGTNPPKRWMQTSGSVSDDRRIPLLNPEQAIICQRLIVDTLDDKELAEKLESQADVDSLTGKQLLDEWQRILTLVQQVKTEAISRFGLPSSSLGILHYEKQISKMMTSQDRRAAEELRQVSFQLWDVVLRKAFSCTSFRRIGLREARNITEQLQEACAEEDFLKKIDDVLKSTDISNRAAVDTHKTLVNLVIPHQMNTLKRFGFDGAKGFVSFQASIMEHIVDEGVSMQLMSASESVFKRAGLARNTRCE